MRMCRLLNPLDTPSGRRRSHLQVLELVSNHDEARSLYLDFQKRVAIANQMPKKSEWDSKCVSALKIVAEAISGQDKFDPITAFLEYPSREADAAELVSLGDNVFCHPVEDPAVRIRVGSIHSVKGETHTATLVLDTFYYKHSYAALKPWLLGQKSGGAGEGRQNITRLKQHYVAMTRPTHLICLAARADTFTASEIEVLRGRGWRVGRVGINGTMWL